MTLPDDLQPLLVNTDEAARLLGMSRSHLEKLRLTDGPQPPHIKIGRAVRYSPKALTAWVATQTKGN